MVLGGSGGGKEATAAKEGMGLSLSAGLKQLFSLVTVLIFCMVGCSGIGVKIRSKFSKTGMSKIIAKVMHKKTGLTMIY